MEYFIVEVTYRGNSPQIHILVYHDSKQNYFVQKYVENILEIFICITNGIQNY